MNFDAFRRRAVFGVIGRVGIGLIATALMLAGCRSTSSTGNNNPLRGPVTVGASPPPPGPTRGRPAATGAAMPESAAPEQMRLGNPDGATGNPSSVNKWLTIRPQFALSYNDSWRFPNWVSWRLQAPDVGNVERGQFYPDSALPSGYTRVTPSDYTKSGYDRGHNCPSKDRTATREDNDAVFTMINITPQAHGLNAGPWEGLESYSRTLAADGNDVYIVCGHGFRDQNFKRIGRSGVAVPDFGWKIVVAIPEGAPITADARVIAVEMPNINTISRQNWQEYITTPAKIEANTGLHFFSALPGPVADALRQKMDAEANDPAAQRPKRSRRRN